MCRLRESGSALPQQPAPCGAAAGTTSPHNSPTRSCPHARRHLVGHACSPASSFWSGPSTLAPCVGHSPRVRTPWSHVSLITSMVYRCVLSYVVSLIWSALVFLVSCWCGLVLSARVYQCGLPWCFLCPDDVVRLLYSSAGGACRRLCPLTGGSPTTLSQCLW